MKNQKLKKRVYYVGDVGCRDTALAIHARNMGYMFKKLNYDVVYFCENWDTQRHYNSDKDFKYFYTKKYLKFWKFSSLEWILEKLTGIKIFNLLKSQVKIKKPDIVVLYGIEGEEKIINFCKKENIPVILERCDWFEKEDRATFLEKNFVHNKTEYAMRVLDMQADGIIAISKYLYNYYKKNNKHVVFIPPMFKVEQNNKIDRFYKDEKIHLAYAGSLGGNKDQILPVMNVLKEINKKEIKIYLDIVGVTMEDIEKETQCNNWNKYGVYAYGRLSNEKTKEIVKKADFSLLLRQNKRYAKAGFSTKFTESMCLGVPVICTKVGGADSIISDMKDGVHLKDNSYDTLLQVLGNLLILDSNQIAEMKKNAFETAMKVFTLEANENKMLEFLNEISE
jgi:Glycosyltransferase